ncbi:MAG: hypothetical protein NZ700_10325 [Gemmataceae bacterium]|nr:hypothetical protein [Gemmataceae bacterium]MDW8265166.1 hypothetical protein [Gemmataceae bacterium]
MNSLRLITLDGHAMFAPCCRCAKGQQRWDRIAGKPYCPHCQEALARGEAPPLVERTEPRVCAACARRGTVAFISFPLDHAQAVEIDLCPDHLRGLVARQLGPHAYFQLARQLHTLGIDADDIFLLHGAFYDECGRALRPALDTDE